MHPHRSKPEQNYRNFEIIEKGITEKDRAVLQNVLQDLKSLLTSLTTPGEDTLKYLYGRLIDEQSSSVPNGVLIDQLKMQMLGAYLPYHNKLMYSLKADFSPQLLSMFQKRDIDLPHLASGLLDDIAEFMKQPLSSNVKRNSFRLSVWLEKIHRSVLVIERLLSDK